MRRNDSSANDDAATVSEDAAGALIDVLANDTDGEGDAIEITGALGSPQGSVAVVQGAPDRLAYTPAANYCNSPGAVRDAVSCSVNGGDTATVLVTVTCVQDAAVANDDPARSPRTRARTRSTSWLTTPTPTATRSGSRARRVRSTERCGRPGPAHVHAGRRLLRRGRRDVRRRRRRQRDGRDHGHLPARAADVRRHARDDRRETGQKVIRGTARRDVILGGSASETIDGRGGNDKICGGKGNDTIRGGAGKDKLRGDDGRDRLFGDAGNDLLLGGKGHDDLRGGAGADRSGGGDGNDRVDGGAGNDRLDEVSLGGAGNDRLYGGSGNDRVLSNGATRDRIDCGAGRDSVRMDRRDTQKRCERITRVRR